MLKNYIHLNYRNYLAWSGGKGLGGWIARQMATQQKYNEASLIEIENQLNRYFPPDERTKLVKKIGIDYTEQDLYEDIANALNMNLDEVQTGTLAPTRFYEKFDEITMQLHKMGRKGTHIETLKAQIDALTARVTQGGFVTGEKTKAEIQALLTSIQKISAKIDDWIAAGAVGATGKRSTFISYRKPLEGLGSLEDLGLIDKLRRLEELLKSGNRQKHGEFAEAIAAITAYLAASKIENIQEDFLQKGVVGILKDLGVTPKAKSASAINMRLLFNGLNQSDLANKIARNRKGKLTFRDDEYGILYSSNYTEDKVDANILFDNDSTLRSIRSTIKNYSFKNQMAHPNIHFVTTTNILSLLQAEERFLNHWLNVYPERIIPASMKRSYKNWGRPTDGERKIAEEQMRYYLTKEAIAGGRYARQENGNSGFSPKAEILIINNHDTGRFKVYDINALLNQLKNNLDLVTIDAKPNLWDIKNTYVYDNGALTLAGATRRITNLIGDLASIKLKLSVSKGFFIDGVKE